jgi:hypothetical protein
MYSTERLLKISNLKIKTMFINTFKPKSLLSIALLASTVTVSSQGVVKAQSEDISEILVQTAEIMNKSLPMMVSPGVQWDSSVAGPGKKLSYEYTLVDYSVDEIDGKEFAQNISQSITNEICTNPMTQIFPENGVLLNFNVYDNSHNLITQVEVENSDCNP